MRERKKKEKVDLEALKSAFMRVPHMPVRVARYLLDIGYTEIYELPGLSPELLFDKILARDFLAERDAVLPALRLAVYFAENKDSADRALLDLNAWKD